MILGLHALGHINQLTYSSGDTYSNDFIDRFKDLPKDKLKTDYSPILNIENIKTPVLLMHSQYDMRVPLDHSLRFYEEAKKQNKPVYLWIEERNSRHNSIDPYRGTLDEAKTQVNREVAIIEKFVNQRKTGYSDKYFSKWHHAYPERNNDDILGGGMSRINDNPDQAYYRKAVATLSKTPNRDIDAYVENNIDPKIMLGEIQQMLEEMLKIDTSLLTEENLKKMKMVNSSYTQEFKDAFIDHLGEYLPKDSDIKYLNFIDPLRSIESIAFSANHERLMKKYDEINKLEAKSAEQYNAYIELQRDRAKEPLLENDVAEALLKTYATYYTKSPFKSLVNMVL
jgi:hypothetical protein